MYCSAPSSMREMFQVFQQMSEAKEITERYTNVFFFHIHTYDKVKLDKRLTTKMNNKTEQFRRYSVIKIMQMWSCAIP